VAWYSSQQGHNPGLRVYPLFPIPLSVKYFEVQISNEKPDAATEGAVRSNLIC